jgi:hypothetical protein
MKTNTARPVAAGVKWILICIFYVKAVAGDAPQDPSVPQASSAQDLAREKHNPFADQITVPIQVSSSLDVGPGNGTAGGLNLQPAIPISLSENWKLITRPSLSLLLSEQPNRKLGFGDIELQTYLTPADAEKWIWGMGADLQLPTATENEFGTGKWSAGQWDSSKPRLVLRGR